MLRSREDTLDSILTGNRRILDFASHAGTRKFLLTSSGAVYGVQPPEISHLSEDFSGAPNCLNPSSAYAEGKRTAELMTAIHSQSSTCEFKIARCFAFCGPKLPLDSDYALGNFLYDALAGRAISVEGDGTPVRSYLYPSDLAVWLWTIFFKGAPLRPYKVGSKREITVADLAVQITNLVESIFPISIAKSPVEVKKASRYVPCNTRISNELGLSETISLKEGLKRTIRWMESQSRQNLS